MSEQRTHMCSWGRGSVDGGDRLEATPAQTLYLYVFGPFFSQLFEYVYLYFTEPHFEYIEYVFHM